MCSLLALPRSLGEVLPLIGAPVAKDHVGRRLMLSLSRPNRKTGAFPELTPRILERVQAYNVLDVEGLAAVHAAVGNLPEHERAAWEMDQAINARGVGIDLELVRAAKGLAETVKKGLFAEYDAITGGLTENGLTPHQVPKTRDWLSQRGLFLDNLQETTIEEALKAPDLLPEVRRVLEIRQALASNALTKFDAMQAVTDADGRARGLFQYHAATPGRWSGQLIQPQNLPRPTVEIADSEIEEVVEAIKTDTSLGRWGKPLDVLESSLRFALVCRD
jgi:DNA polymerase